MKYFASLCAIVLAGSLPGLAASAHPTSVHAQFQNQFHFQPSKSRAAQIAAHSTSAKQKQGHDLGKLHGPASKLGSHSANSHPSSAKNVRRHTANPPTGKTGFVSALEISAGTLTTLPPVYGATYYPAVSGDFDGNGTPDVAAEVETWDGTTQAYAVSVVLNNGDGTFKQAVLSPTTDTCALLIVADVNNDGKSDLIVGHQPNTCGNSNSNPAFDVWLSNGDGKFTLSSNVNNSIPTSGAAGGTVADTNGDGKVDVVLVDDGNPANVWTLTGNGDGTFNAATSVALNGEAGNHTVLADLNGDGILDIVDNDYSTNQVTVYLATSATTYANGVSYDTVDLNHNACGNSNASSLAVGDINGDGVPEVVNANCSDAGNDVTVYVNNGDGTFATGAYYDGAMSGGTNSGAATVYTEAVTIGDVNGDGMGDIICVNDDSSDVTVLLGKSDGTVTVPNVGYAVGGYPYEGAIVGDFNGDGMADIMLPDDQMSFAFLKGYGDGTFRAAQNHYAATTSYSYGYGVATGDFNKDGHPDFVIGDYCYSCTTPMGITVFLSNPDGSLQPGMNFGTTSYFGFVAVADFDGDGNLDVAATDYSTGLVQIFNGDGTGNLTPGNTFSTDLASNDPYGVYAADFNEDGHPDLAIANYSGDDIAILLNDGTGSFPTPVPITLSGSVWEGVGVADINGDGHLDMVAPLYNGSNIAVLLGNGDGTFQAEQDFPIGANYPEQLVLADLNGDGKLDVATTLRDGGGLDIAYAMGAGDGTFGTFTVLPSSTNTNYFYSPYPEGIQAMDVDGDGFVDLVYVNSNYSTIGVMFAQSTGGYYDPVEYPVGQYNWSVVGSDLNGDGSWDLVSASDDFAGVTTLLNNNGVNTLGAYTIQASAAQVVTAGQTATFTLTITPVRHYNGTITLSCPAGLPSLATCSFSPSANVTLDGLTPQTVTLTITTKAPSTSSMRLHSSLEPQSNPRPRNSAMMLASLNGVGLFGMFLAGNFNKKRIRSSMMGVLVVGLFLFLVGCGGSSNSTTPPTKGNSTSTVTSSAATVLVGQQVTFTGTVAGTSGTPTGTVTFLDGTTSLGTGTLTSGSATFKTTALAAGVHNITISYGGDSNFNTSTSAAYSQTVDKPGTPLGSYAITVTGSGTQGTNGLGSNPSIQVGVTVQ